MRVRENCILTSCSSKMQTRLMESVLEPALSLRHTWITRMMLMLPPNGLLITWATRALEHPMGYICGF